MNLRLAEKSISAARIKKQAYGVCFRIIRGILLAGLVFLILYPIFVKAAASLMSNSDIYNPSVVFLPKNPTFENFITVWNAVEYPIAFAKTFALSFTVGILQVISCTLVAYGLAKFRFYGRRIIMGLVIFTLVIPTQTILTPLYIRFRFFDITQLLQIGGELSGISLINTVLPITLLSATATAFKNGLYIFILLQHFKNSPKVLEEAAFIDGCGRFATFTRIAVPGAVPMLVTIFLFAFVWQWTDYYYTSIFIPEMDFLTSRLLDIEFSWIAGISGDYAISVSYAPRVLLLIFPLVIVYLFTQRFFVESVERSGIVG